MVGNFVMGQLYWITVLFSPSPLMSCMYLYYNWIRFCLLIKSTWHPQKRKNAKYTKTALKMVPATAPPSSGSLMEPIIDSWPVLNNKPRTDNITTANVESTVQKYALPLDTTAFIMRLG